VIYRKLAVVLLSVVSTEPAGSTNAVIAEYLLTHRGEAATMGVRQLAEACAVGTGSISRFCREVGLAGFTELHSALAEDEDVFERVQGPDARRQWAREAAGALGKAALSVSQAKLAELAREVRSNERVSAFGLLKAEAAAFCLQTDLLLLGKRVYTSVAYADQMAHILSAPADELTIVFSYTGDYFGYRAFKQDEVRNLRKREIWVVCPRGVELPDFVSDVVPFDSDGSQLGHPYQLEAVASLLAQEYAALT
jgi:hypothetical protein